MFKYLFINVLILTTIYFSASLLYEIEFNGGANRKSVTEQNAKYSTCLPSKINSSKDKIMSLPWHINLTDKCNLHFNAPNVH